MILFDPPYLSGFFLSTHLMQGTPLSKAWEYLKADLPSTYITDVVVWTPIQLLNFRFIPVHFQPQIVSVVNIGWNAYLSWVQHDH